MGIIDERDASGEDTFRVTSGPLGWVGRHPMGAALLLVGLWILTAVIPLGAAALPLYSGQRAAQAGQDSLRDVDLAAAREHLARAHDEFRSGRRALDNPAAWLGGYFPGLGQNLRAARAVAEAGELTARAGRDLTDAVLDLPQGLDSLRPSGGALPLDELASLEPALATATADLRAAQTRANEGPRWLVHGRVLDAREQLLERLGPLVPGAERAHALSRSLPSFLGVDEPRRYLFGAANPAEMRGTGGFIGAFTILTVDEGRLDFGQFSQIHDLPGPEAGEVVPPPSEDFAARYDRYGGASSWLSLNVTPDFPTAARGFVQLYEAALGEELDGVIVTDPFAMAALAEVAGPVEVPGRGTLGADEVVRYMTHDAFEEYEDHEERKEELGEVAALTLGGFLQAGGGDPRGVISALGEAAAGGHILLYSAHTEVQQDLAAAGLDGGIPKVAGDLVMPVLNSSTNAKTDFYLEIDATYDVTLLEDGSSRGLLSTHLVNGAPTEGVDGYIIGPNRPGLSAGDQRFIYSAYCAEGCEILGTDRDGSIPPRTSVEEEHGHSLVVIPRVELASGEETTVNVEWRADDTWRMEDGLLVYELATRLQPFIQGPTLAVRVGVPDGTEAHEVPDGAEVTADHVAFEVSEVGDRRFTLSFAPLP